MLQITKRERGLSIGLVVTLAAWALYAWAVQPARERIRTLQRIIPEKQAQLQDLQTKAAQYTALRSDFTQRRANLALQEPDFQLSSFLEAKLERHKLARQVVTMVPDTLQVQPDYAEVVVTVELRDVSLKQLVDFLSDVETAKTNVRVGSLHIRKNPHNEALLDSTIGIYSPKLGPQALAAQTAR